MLEATAAGSCFKLTANEAELRTNQTRSSPATLKREKNKCLHIENCLKKNNNFPFLISGFRGRNQWGFGVGGACVHMDFSVL